MGHFTPQGFDTYKFVNKFDFQKKKKIRDFKLLLCLCKQYWTNCLCGTQRFNALKDVEAIIFCITHVETEAVLQFDLSSLLGKQITTYHLAYLE